MAFLILWGLILLGIALWSRAASSGLPKYRIAEYVPPEGDVIMHGLLARADRRLVGAAMVGMAIKGRVRILAPRGERGPVALEAVLGQGLTSQERMLLNCFRPTNPTEKQARRFQEGLEEIGVDPNDPVNHPDIYFLKGRGAARGYQRRQLDRYFENARTTLKNVGLAKRRQNGVFLGVLSLLFLVTEVVLAVGVLGAIINGDWLPAIITAAFLVAYFFVLFAAAPPFLRFTDTGRELRVHLSGLREYIRLGEQDRLRFTQSPETALRTPAGTLTPAGQALGLSPRPQAPNPAAQSDLDQVVLTEELLPYAVLFHQEDNWGPEFARFDAMGLRAQNLRAVSSTMEGVIAVMQVLYVVLQILRVIGAVLSLGGRHD